MTENKERIADVSNKMSDKIGKLKCLFCGAELDMCDELYWSCTNRQCEIWSDMIPKSVWQALIDGKKAQDTLKRAKEIYVRDIYYWEESEGLHPLKTDIENFFDKEIATKQENDETADGIWQYAYQQETILK